MAVKLIIETFDQKIDKISPFFSKVPNPVFFKDIFSTETRNLI